MTKRPGRRAKPEVERTQEEPEGRRSPIELTAWKAKAQPEAQKSAAKPGQQGTRECGTMVEAAD